MPMPMNPQAQQAINVAANMDQSTGSNSAFLGQPPIITKVDSSGNVQTTAQPSRGVQQMSNMQVQAPAQNPYGYGQPAPVQVPTTNPNNVYMQPQAAAPAVPMAPQVGAGQQIQAQQAQAMQSQMLMSQQVQGQPVVPAVVNVPNHLQGAGGSNVSIPAHLQSPVETGGSREEIGLYKDYVLPVSNGLISTQKDLDLAERFRQQSFNSGIDSESATRSLEHTLQFNKEQATNQVESTQMVLQQQWGQNYDQNMAGAKEGFKHAFPNPLAQKEAIANGFLNNPQNIMNLHNMNSQMGAAPLNPGQPVAQAAQAKTPQNSIVELTNTMADFGAANTIDTAQSSATKEQLKNSLNTLLRGPVDQNPQQQGFQGQLAPNPAFGNLPMGTQVQQPQAQPQAGGLQGWSSSPVF